MGFEHFFLFIQFELRFRFSMFCLRLYLQHSVIFVNIIIYEDFCSAIVADYCLDTLIEGDWRTACRAFHPLYVLSHLGITVFIGGIDLDCVFIFHCLSFLLIQGVALLSFSYGDRFKAKYSCITVELTDFSFNGNICPGRILVLQADTEIFSYIAGIDVFELNRLSIVHLISLFFFIAQFGRASL